MDNTDITIKLSSNRLNHVLDKPNFDFGTEFTDHMFIMDFSRDLGWHNPRIEPYKPMSISPASMVLHYGQGIFEGLKCYRNNDKFFLFRPWDNFTRLNKSCKMLCIPKIDEVFALNALKKLIQIDKNWVPKTNSSSLYIRPTIIATEGALGVRPSNLYRFFIILSPVSGYYKKGFNLVKIKIEKEYARVAKNSVGEAKTMGNYATGLFANKIAQKEGFAQVVWLDSIEKKYIEEIGNMNIFFLIKDKLITPNLSGSILPGITRDSVIKLAKIFNIEVVERPVSVDELFKAFNNNSLKEVFGTATAFVISPIGELGYGDQKIIIGDKKIGKITTKMYNTLTNIQYGRIKDNMGWNMNILN